MRHPHVSRWLGLGLAGVVVVLIGARPTLKAGPPATSVASAAVGGAFGGGSGAAVVLEAPPTIYLSAPPMSRDAARTYARLQEKVGMNFPTDTPLDEVKRYIEEVTAEKDDPNSGVPLFFEPQGLQDADKTMQSTVSLAFKRPIPLATSLKLILDQVGLKYSIQEDGIVVVTSKDGDSTPAEAGPLILNTLAEIRAEVKALREEVRLFRRGEPATSSPTGPHPGGAASGPNPATGGGATGAAIQGGFR